MDSTSSRPPSHIPTELQGRPGWQSLGNLREFSDPFFLAKSEGTTHEQDPASGQSDGQKSTNQPLSSRASKRPLQNSRRKDQPGAHRPLSSRASKRTDHFLRGKQELPPISSSRASKRTDHFPPGQARLCPPQRHTPPRRRRHLGTASAALPQPGRHQHASMPRKRPRKKEEGEGRPLKKTENHMECPSANTKGARKNARAILLQGKQGVSQDRTALSATRRRDTPGTSPLGRPRT